MREKGHVWATRCTWAACLAVLGAASQARAGVVWPVGPDRTPADWVEPRIGTATSRWFFFNSACRPFGMVNLSPDTRTGGDWGNGYLYGDTKIRCFSHIHGWQLYGVAVMPFTG